MTLEESREIIPLMESMIGQIEEQSSLATNLVFSRVCEEFDNQI